MAVERSGVTRKSRSSDTVNAVAGAATAPSVDTALPLLAESRLLDLCRLFGCEVHGKSVPKDRVTRLLADHLRDRLPALFKGSSGATSSEPFAAGTASTERASPLGPPGARPRGRRPRPPRGHVRPPAPSHDGLPARGQTVHARHRQWLVDDVNVGEADDSP